MFVLVLVLFPRIFIAVGLPKVLAFLHFLVTPLMYVMSLRESLKINRFRRINLLIILYLFAVLVSTLNSGAGIINFFLSSLMILTPIMLLVFMGSYKWSGASLKSLEKFVIGFSVIHVILALGQFFILGYRDDDVEGVFIGMGAGGHLAGGVAVIAATWVYQISWLDDLFKKVTVFFLLLIVILSDSKQVIAVLAVSALIFIFIGQGGVAKKIKYMFAFVFFVIIIVIIANTVFPALLVYLLDNRIIDGIEQKLAVFPVVISFYEGWDSWLFGLGPGHTVSRLATMLPSYDFLSSSLGATSHDATNAVYLVKQSQYLSNTRTGSSMFSLDFSLSGIWGDMGLLGILVFGLLYREIWSIAREADGASAIFIISVMVYGFVFTWIEEPGFMMILMAYVGYACQCQMKNNTVKENNLVVVK